MNPELADEVQSGNIIVIEPFLEDYLKA